MSGVVLYKKVAIAQIDSKVGDFEGNAAKIIDFSTLAEKKGAEIVVFPEFSLCGYPPEDLLFYTKFITDSKNIQNTLLCELKKHVPNLHVFFGNIAEQKNDNRIIQNALFEALNGEIVRKYTKRDLPNYGVFDEQRYFTADSSQDFRLENSANVAVAICEDIWNGIPLDVQKSDEVIIVINASPFSVLKFNQRVQTTKNLANEYNLPVVYANLVGAQDELVFDGGSFILDENAEVVSICPKFIEKLALEHDITEHTDELLDIYSACVSGLRAYAFNNGFHAAVLGLSGGIDSALVATMAVDAIADVVGIAMPSVYSSSSSLADAASLANNLGIKYIEQPLGDIFNAYTSLDSNFTSNIALENIQARIRGNFLMSYANSNSGCLVLATGNKSELAVGYSTVYGDAIGGFAPIKDVYKTKVWELAKRRNELSFRDLKKLGFKGSVNPIPTNSITKPPSAELKPGQLDSDTLPDYTELDAKLEQHIENYAQVDEHIMKMVKNAEWKRRQYPIGPKITTRSFGKDFRMPITQSTCR
ncbi:MAG: NAD+ synthase [Candidatus Ancillula sp.]|jgi:NAD+ synthase (glutamine-hydrolysing)|nr:NAD+ synthase [Candidatus Ancillula sp.]